MCQPQKQGIGNGTMKHLLKPDDARRIRFLRQFCMDDEEFVIRALFIFISRNPHIIRPKRQNPCRTYIFMNQRYIPFPGGHACQHACFGQRSASVQRVLRQPVEFMELYRGHERVRASMASTSKSSIPLAAAPLPRAVPPGVKILAALDSFPFPLPH